MRSFEDIEHRWSQLFNTSIGVDLRQAVREDSSLDPCEQGLRSVCWRAFLLYGPLSQGSWTKKLSESRSAYTSLRDHFLRYINNPNDLHSSSDPLADDDNSPWSSLRQDELTREEIFQDVTRCMQDNYYFREPNTQRKLLDILFIFSKLNPDTGYRQGMHELLAPILWVISQDVVDTGRVPVAQKEKEGIEFMLDVLDKKFMEHDAFSLFCAVMQTAKSFYELGEKDDSAVIVAQSQRIQYELLMAVDPDLARHLEAVGVLPQIYAIRWIRLLFGREFDFKDVLKIWDYLFAENLTIEVIDMTCVAMLLRVHWQLIDADYTMAITQLTKFQLPSSGESPRTLVNDAILLNRNKSTRVGADLVQRYSGQRPQDRDDGGEQTSDAISPVPKRVSARWGTSQSSPTRSPARFTTPQRQLETLFSEVSGNLQRRTEGWSKTVRGAVGEVRKNMNSLQTSHSRTASIDQPSDGGADASRALQERLRALETRNKALSKMLESSLESLRSCRASNPGLTNGADDDFNLALAKLQFVSVYLSDSDIPIPSNMGVTKGEDDRKAKTLGDSEQLKSKQEQTQSTAPKTVHDEPASKPAPVESTKQPEKPTTADNTSSDLISEFKTPPRPSLSDASFSFMLGEGRQRSSFVSSASELPEQRRDSESRARPKQLWAEPKEKHQHERKDDVEESDGFTLSALG